MLLPREVKGIEVEFVARYVNCVDVGYVGTLYTEVCTRFSSQGTSASAEWFQFYIRGQLLFSAICMA